MRRLFLVCLTLLFGVLHAAAQDKTITGRVTDQASGEGLPGVTVLLKGTTTGTQTDGQGGFSLALPTTTETANARLVFSSIGFGTVERLIGSDTNITVALGTDTKQLGEVVVTALGLEAQSDQLGTAISTVKGGSLVQSGETSVITALSGKTPGVLITRSSGDPGASANIQIRGANTILNSNQPLIVVDGIPISNSSIGNDGILTSIGGAGSNQTDGVVQASRLNDINPSDIASIEVLKGAAAAALWGSRASNGVLIITTKKGQAGDKVNISVRSAVGFDRINKTVPLQTTYGQGTNGRYSQTNPRSWGDKISDRTGGADAFITDPAAPGYRGFITFDDGSKRYALAAGSPTSVHGGKNSRNTFDHNDELFRTGYTLDNQVSVSGGDLKSKFYLSLGNTHTQGIAKRNSDNDRSTIRFNADRQLAEKFRVGVNVTYARTVSNRVQQGSNLSGIFLGGLRTPADVNNEPFTGTYTDVNGNIFRDRQVSFRNPVGANSITDDAGNVIGNPGFDNPFWTIDRVKNQTRVNRVLGSVEMNYDITSWLALLNRTGVDYYTDRRMEYFPLGSGAAVQGKLTEEEISEGQFNNDVILRATRSLNENINLNALVGFNVNSRRSSQVGASVTSFVNPFSPPQVDNTPATTRTPFNLLVEQRTAAAYAQVDLSLFDQVFLSGTGRSESASTFGPEAQSTFFYPAATVAWQFTKLAPLADNAFLSFGKLRVAYGSVGIQPTPYLTRTYYVPAGNSSLVDGYTLGVDAANYGGGFKRSTTLGNAKLRPERKTEIEAGFDLRFLQDRIKLGATVYNNESKDVILQVPVAATTGFQLINDNAATVRNRGIELDLSADVIKTEDFQVTLSPNFSKNRNEVVDLSGAESVSLTGFEGSQSRAVKGYQLGALWGNRWARNDQGKQILNADGFPTQAATEGIIGDPNPKWRGALGATVRYKGLSVYALVDHVNNIDVWNGTKGALYSYGAHADLSKETTVSAAQAATLKLYNGQTVAERYTANTDGSYTFRGNITNFGGGDVVRDEQWYRLGLGNGFNGPAEQFVENVNYTRLREVTLSYSIGSQAFRDFTKLRSIDLSITGRNLVLWTDYTGVDPETNLTGVSNGRGLDYFNNPSTRSILFTVQFNY
ncbi:MAG: SusC/RagA family TonB-linked outer membrane protein [Hymenobacteraceae bacterium]|nr:SusC/RagA family TonB-linked outer membrane protein [Hymenobacteraceae bacterium]